MSLGVMESAASSIESGIQHRSTSSCAVDALQKSLCHVFPCQTPFGTIESQYPNNHIDRNMLQRLAEAAGTLLSSVLQGLLCYYQRDSAAAAPFLAGTEAEGLPVEAWLHLGQDKASEELAEQLKPQWHVPSQGEVLPFSFQA